MSFLLGAVEGLSTWSDCVRPWRELSFIGFGFVSVSASEAACGFKIGVANFPERISSFRGDTGEKGASRERTLGVVLFRNSGSSGMVSLDRGRVVLPALRDAILSGEATLSVVVIAEVAARDEGRDVVVEEVIGRFRVAVVGLPVVALVALLREAKVDGRLGGAEAALLLPNVVRRVAVAVLSVLESGFAVLELKDAAVGVVARDKRLFSSLVVASSVDFVVGLRIVEEDMGRVGGFVMVEPLARDDNALVRLAEGDVVDLEDGALSRSVTDILFFVSSPAADLAVPVAGVLLGGRLSILPTFPLAGNMLLLVTAFALVV